MVLLLSLIMKRRGRPSNTRKPSSISSSRPSSIDSESALGAYEDRRLLLESGIVKKRDPSITDISLIRLIDNLPVVSLENDLLRKFRFLAFLWSEGSDISSSPSSSISSPRSGYKKQKLNSSPGPNLHPPAKRPRSTAQCGLNQDYPNGPSNASSRHVSIPKPVPRSAKDEEHEEQIKKFMKLCQEVEEKKRASNAKRDSNQNAMTH